jgi:hypothetical protein
LINAKCIVIAMHYTCKAVRMCNVQNKPKGQISLSPISDLEIETLAFSGHIQDMAEPWLRY